MRTQKEQINNFVKGMAFGLVVVMVMLTTAGCPSKKSGGAGGGYRDGWYRGNYGYGRAGYNGFGSVSYIGMGTDTQQRAQVILEMAQESDITTGSAMVMGELDVSAPIMCFNASFPIALEPGYYQIEPINNGSAIAYGELLQSATVIAYGPFGEAVLQITNGYFFRGRTGDYDGLQAQITVQSVDGIPCGASFVVSDQNWL